MKTLNLKTIKRYTILLSVFLGIGNAYSAEITAIDFNGDLIGKVISDGKVVSYENELLGNITADSLIVNDKGALIGGVVPQGIAIGMDNRILGKVNSDGSVRLSSGKIIGKVLPNGLVLNDNFKIIGGVLFPGLVYSDRGETIGRLTGNGEYTDLSGRKKGYITPDGYAYNTEGGESLLEGRLISNKIVISPQGAFVGSIVPGGEIRDMDGQKIGQIHANGLGYNEEGKIIGQIVKNGSNAFDENGNYLGLVSYNGEIINKGNIVGYQGLNNKVINSNGQEIGFLLDISSTFTNSKGEYIGRLMPTGKIAKAREVVGTIGASGSAWDKEGKFIGKSLVTGPLFDYLGKIKAQSTASGEIRGSEGNVIGFSYGDKGYGTNGRMLGKTLKNTLALDLNNQSLGIPGISGIILQGDKSYQATPFGYVYSSEGQLNGQQLNDSSIYSLNGIESGQIDVNGTLSIKGSETGGRLTQSGIAFRENGSLLGGQVWVERALSFLKENLANKGKNNLIFNSQNKIIGKILPDLSVVKTDEKNSSNLMPEIGRASKADLALSFRGEHLGYVMDNGEVKDLSGAIIGHSDALGIIKDNNGLLIGEEIGYQAVVDDECQPLGFVTSTGEVRNNRGVRLGRMLLNAQTIDDGGVVIGHGVTMGLVMGESGIVGSISADGKVLNPENKMLGCLEHRGRLYRQDGSLQGIRVSPYPVMNFESNMIGRTILNNQVVNKDNQIIGQSYPDENVKSDDGRIIGRLFKYRYAFDNQNRYLGEISIQGTVSDSAGKEIGKASKEGFIKDAQGQNIGYALYDMYVYDENMKTKGIIGIDGQIRTWEGARLGQLDRGFLVDRLGKVLARGNRDYAILNEKNEVLGELTFNGELKNNKGVVIGKLEEEGNIYDDDGVFIGKANALQYYNVTQDREKIYDMNGKEVGYVAGEGNVYDENGKLIGRMDEDGTVKGADGSIIGGKGKDWYTRQPMKQPSKDLPQIGVYEKNKTDEPLIEGKYKKSLNIALTPDGEYLGDILEDGRVVDKQGNYLGRRTPDGLIIDDEGTLIGIEDVARPEGGELFIPAGTFGDGGAYGTGSVGGNLGPGGGFGPGERYDPQRAAALAAAQNYRRQNMAVGHIASKIKPETFDGYQKNWDNEGISKAISSWRVDMSEMILADKPIPAVISRSIDSNNPTPITAYVERNVYAEEGRNVIIPAGSRLMGTLNSMTATTETTSSSARVQITWERLIRPDGVLFTFDGVTADAMGRGGALGYLDQQLFKKYTLPVMTTVLTSYTSYLLATNEDNNGEIETSRQQAANDARENFLNQMNEVFSEILADKSNIKPLTYVPAGTRIIVFPNVDLWLRTAERDTQSTDQERTDLLLDDKQTQQQINEANMNRQAQSAANVNNNSQAVYQPQGSGGTATNSSPKLLDDNRGSNNINGAVPPPPPPSSSNLTTATPVTERSIENGTGSAEKASSSKAQTDESVPQLF